MTNNSRLLLHGALFISACLVFDVVFVSSWVPSSPDGPLVVNLMTLGAIILTVVRVKRAWLPEGERDKNYQPYGYRNDINNPCPSSNDLPYEQRYPYTPASDNSASEERSRDFFTADTHTTPHETHTPQHQTDINPATGLVMHGFVDIGGNTYGFDHNQHSDLHAHASTLHNTFDHQTHWDTLASHHDMHHSSAFNDDFHHQDMHNTSSVFDDMNR